MEYEMRRLGIRVAQDILDNIAGWFAEVTQETEKSVESSIAIEGEVTLGGESPFPIPFLAKLLAKLTSQIKGGAKTKTTIRRDLEQDFSRLKFNVNLLLDDCTRKLR
ncbi:MAG: hypothetical protein RML75_06345 [Cyanobacteriota bacterium SKYGB_h_bin112]|nr:hypothetical protein [Cyanobacteriota bacterium SKYGB_h_bin112]